MELANDSPDNLKNNLDNLADLLVEKDETPEAVTVETVLNAFHEATGYENKESKYTNRFR